MMELGHASADMVQELLKPRFKKSRLPPCTTSSPNWPTSASTAGACRPPTRCSSTSTPRTTSICTTAKPHLPDVMDDELQSLMTSHMKRRKFRGYTVEDIDIQLIASPTSRKIHKRMKEFTFPPYSFCLYLASRDLLPQGEHRGHQLPISATSIRANPHHGQRWYPSCGGKQDGERRLEAGREDGLHPLRHPEPGK